MTRLFAALLVLLLPAGTLFDDWSGDSGLNTSIAVTEPTIEYQIADPALREMMAAAARSSAGVVNVRGLGAAGDGATNDAAVFQRALDAASTREVVVPAGAYYMGTTTLHISRQVLLRGAGAGLVGEQPAKLIWDAGTPGVVVHTEDSAPTGASAEGSIIEGLRFESRGGADPTAHGVWLRARSVLRNIRVHGFPGNAVQIVATCGGGRETAGNANNWRIDTARLTGSRLSGLYVDGTCANAGTATGVDASGNGRWGIWDSSLLGNTYVGAHTQSNGLAAAPGNGGMASSVVHLDGRRYAANATATAEELAATQPGTDGAVWLDIGRGREKPGVVPTWNAGGDYFVGGSYRTDNPNADNLILGSYAEPGQGPPQYVLPTIVIGGTQQHTARGSYVHVLASSTEGRVVTRGGDMLVRSETDSPVLDRPAGRSIGFKQDGEWRWAIDSSNDLRPAGSGNDNRFDLGSASHRIRDLHVGGDINATGLPTSDPGVPGRLWNDAGVLKVSQ